MNYITASGRRNKVKRGIKEIGGDVVQSAGSMLGLKNTGISNLNFIDYPFLLSVWHKCNYKYKALMVLINDNHNDLLQLVIE